MMQFSVVAFVVVATVAADGPSAPGTAANEKPSSPGEENSEGVVLKKKQSLIKGLLIAELGASNFAGKASQMNATATPNGGDGPATLEFNQKVGPDMEQALREVRKHLTVRHNGWPVGHDIELSFEDKYGPKDGPSAAVACALLLEGLISGHEIDPVFAVTGDLNADGSVQPVGGVADKIRGAASRDCRIVAIPKKCVPQIADALITEGIAPLYGIQILTIEKMNDAIAVSSAHRAPGLAEALTTFATVQAVLQKQSNPTATLANPFVQERLRKVLAAAPNHLSAELLLRAGTGQLPTTLSLGGSLAHIDKASDLLLKAIKSKQLSALSPDEMGVVLSGLRRLRPTLDRRTWHYADSLQSLGETVRTFKNQPPRTNPEIAKSLQRIEDHARAVDSEVDRIRSNKMLMEELMR